MKMRNIFYNIALFSFLIGFSYCKKKSSSPPAETKDCSSYLTQLSQDAVNAEFKPGTYWVLFDGTNNRYNSISITNNSITTVELSYSYGDECGAKKAYRYTASISQHTYSPGNANPVAVDEDFKGLAYEDNRFFLSTKDSYQNMEKCGSVSHPSCYGAIFYEEYSLNNNNSVKEKLDSMLFNGVYQKSVEHMTFPKNYFYQNIPFTNKVEFYFNTTIGFMRQVKYDSLNNIIADRKMLRYNIVK